MPVRALIERLLERLEAHAQDLGCAGELEGVREITRQGGGAEWQRQLAAAHGDAALLPALADWFLGG